MYLTDNIIVPLFPNRWPRNDIGDFIRVYILLLQAIVKPAVVTPNLANLIIWLRNVRRAKITPDEDLIQIAKLWCDMAGTLFRRTIVEDIFRDQG